MSLSDDLKFVANKVDKLLEERFKVPSSPESRLVSAMRYSSIGSGKKIRPYIVFASSNIFGVPLSQSILVGTSVEMVHTFSLIHDDLPCMDDDDIRRGKPSLHVQFDESTAVLAGNALLIDAFKLLTSKIINEEFNIRIRLIERLAEVSGYKGMCGGQMADLLSQSNDFLKSEILRLNSMKTAAIISFCCEAGGILGGASEYECKVLQEFGLDIGLAFQIIDDILDVEGEENKTGKKVNKDNELGKKNLVSNYGIKYSKNEAKRLINQANKNLNCVFGVKSEKLQRLAEFIIYRDR
ncbi:MAG: Farnesyl diphosphate synthase [Alphaproteobacteria bacterium MarineAlpha2_Bin1]|nr:MAG: Farnesyl diphosphate synthase [Alphaproteobacteria bacterium MarineAlpha2_Bin1]|tara:strand:- start:1154 stop:2041 length:888 start_codon:yes stop_codon:yes gene_type:complete